MEKQTEQKVKESLSFFKVMETQEQSARQKIKSMKGADEQNLHVGGGDVPDCRPVVE